jgi:hypothetical protein
LIFLLKDKPIESRAQEFDSGLIEVSFEDSSTEVRFIFNVSPLTTQFLGANHLGSLENELIPLSQVLVVFSKYMITLGGLPFPIEERLIEGIVNLQDLKMLKVLFDTVNGQDFFDKGFSPDGIGSTGDPTGVTLSGVYLTDPSGIPITRRSNEELGVEITELEMV